MIVNYGGSTDRRPNADHIVAAIEHALDNVDFTQGRRLQSGESISQPIRSVDVEKNNDAAQANSDTFQVTVAGFGPLLQRISTVIRTFDFLKSVADKLRADGRTCVLRASNTYSPVRVEGQGWDMGPDGKPISITDGTFPYNPVIEYAQFNATVLPATNVGGGEPEGPREMGPASQTIGDEDVPGWGIFLIILIFFLILTPILCYYYARTKYGPDKAGIWLRYMCSHSNPTLPLLYKPREERERIRKQLDTDERYSASPSTQDVSKPSNQTAV